jgi:LysR family transcriptional regulator, benzoate and cis,cis-muconate-responsive activator of ben and cat genes
MNQLETRELAYFVAVAETLHFGQAAERLGITQPPLSRAIAQLERRLGVPLLERTTRQVTLTAAGEVFLAECRSILAAMDTAIRKARKAVEQERVTIAVRPGTGPGVLPALLAAQGPDGVPIDVVFTYDEAGALRDGTADVALMCQTGADAGLERIELGPEQPVVLLPAGHPLTDHPFLTLTDVQALPGYAARLPDEALDTMVDRVALGRLVIVVGDSVRERLGGSVQAVPVHGFPPTQLVLAWLPAARAAVSRLTTAAVQATAAGATHDRLRTTGSSKHNGRQRPSATADQPAG